MITTVPSLIAIINSAMGKERITWKFVIVFSLCFIDVILSMDIEPGSFVKIGLIDVIFVLLIWSSSKWDK